MTATLDRVASPELTTALVDAEREYAAVEREWRDLVAAEAALLGDGTRIVRRRDEGQRTVRTTFTLDGVERHVDEIDDVERVAILDEIAGRRGEVAARYTAARGHLREARRALANATLDRQQAEYERAAQQLDEMRRQVERALGVAFKLLAEYARQIRATRTAMRRLHATAHEGAQDSKPLLEQLKHIESIGDVPIALGDATVTALNGPDFELFADDPKSQTMWDGIARSAWLIVSDPDRTERQLADTTLGRAAGFGKRTR